MVAGVVVGALRTLMLMGRMLRQVMVAVEWRTIFLFLQFFPIFKQTF
jgi:hypothetical protein